MKLRATIEKAEGWRGFNQVPTPIKIQTRSEIEVFPTHVKLKFPDAGRLELILSYEELSDLMTQIQLAEEKV